MTCLSTLYSSKRPDLEHNTAPYTGLLLATGIRCLASGAPFTGHVHEIAQLLQVTLGTKKARLDKPLARKAPLFTLLLRLALEPNIGFRARLGACLENPCSLIRGIFFIERACAASATDAARTSEERFVTLAAPTILELLYENSFAC